VLSFSIITEDTRLTEKEIWQRFEAARPLILGSLFDTVACALRRYPEVDQSKLPRMGDFATFICAAEPALGWSEGSFLAAYRRNIEETNASALEASPLVPAIKRIAAGGPWKGAPSELYDRLLSERLSDMVEFSGQYGQYPNSVKALSQALQRLIPNLQRLGIIVETGRTAGDNSKRFISLRMADVPAWRGSTN
jgi:putative DNA primase/helicase